MEHRRIVESLRRPEAYPFEAGEIRVVQTQISSVVLADGFAYKLKKPVRLPFLDFSTLEKRRRLCEEEVVLNRRLAPDVYLGVVNVTDDGGLVRMEGDGAPLEYAVKMRRLPAERMMNVLLDRDEVGPRAIDGIAEAVSAFHAGARTGPEIDAYGRPDALERELEDDLRQVERFVGTTITGEAMAEIGEYFREWLGAHRDLLGGRVSRGRIRDCHGDMHSGNICLPGRPVIFDCIEFNDAFRYVDVAREVAFLAMDLDSHDQQAMSERYVNSYVEISGDAELRDLLDFYKTWLAMVRGKVYSTPLASDDISVQERKYSVFRARHYFEVALRCAGGGRAPLVLVMMGVMGTGKSVVAREVARMMSMHVIDSDVVRKNLAGLEPGQRRKVGFGEDIYSPEMTEKVYNTMADLTESMVRAGYSVILDASFSKRRYRELIRERATGRGAKVLCVECIAPMEVLESRLVERERADEDVSDGRLELLPRQIAEFESPDEIPPDRFLKLETDAPPGDLADTVIDRIERLYD